MTKIFIDNDWQEYDYDTLYSERGYTNTPSTMLVVYDNSMVQIEGWSNTGFNWIEQDRQWYPNDETPYYVQQSSSISLYKIDKKTTFKVYLNNNESFIIYNNSFTTVENLHNTLGYTETQSQVYLVVNGDVQSWYNEEEGLYWDNRTGNKFWTSVPPTPEDSGSGIPESPLELVTPIAKIDGGVLSINDGFEVYQYQYIDDWLKPKIKSQDKFIIRTYAPMMKQLEPDT